MKIKSPAEQRRAAVKKLMVDVGLDKRGGRKMLSDTLGIDYASIGYALNGTRTGQVYLDMLETVYEYLLKLNS